MGFRICYLASEAPPEVLIDSLDLIMGQNSDEMPEGECWVARLKRSDWTVLWSEDEDLGRMAANRVATLSDRYRTYICEVDETVMWSASELWSEGRQIWKVTHSGDGEDIFNLSVTGDVPSIFSELKEKHFLGQRSGGEDVDHVFEIPLDLAAAEIGFRHDNYLEPDDVDAFFIVSQKTFSPTKERGLISRIFGR